MGPVFCFHVRSPRLQHGKLLLLENLELLVWGEQAGFSFEVG